MCKYCEDNYPYANDEIGGETMKIGKYDAIVQVYVNPGKFNSNLIVDIDIGEIELFSKSYKINYCPMCGRKLVDE